MMAYNNLKALKLTFANVLCAKRSCGEFGKPKGYRMDFLKVLVTMWETQNLYDVELL